MRYHALITAACLCLAAASDIKSSYSLPSYISPCNKTDPNIHKCVEANIEALRPNLKEGVPSLFIPALDPLVIPPTCVNEEDQVKVTFKDIHIYHASDFALDQFDIDLVNHEVNLTIVFPLLRIKSTYSVNGKFLVVTFDESGPADGNYTNFRVFLGLKGSPYIENGEQHLKWEKETINTTVGESHVVLDKLFGNHTDITDKTNNLINENIQVIINDLQPVIQGVVSDFIFGIVNKLFSYYSVKQLFVS
ncbi:circadian clock-controlled protein daywake-like [Rhynchophorus ferrugineus]|uniref:circadian clock-controlled protein daywake-like n=1 Tax=Rhynchophorus ferrugineus TaxID=354439 RepID=UPI003FCC6FF9